MVRIFQVKEGAVVKEFRRGTMSTQIMSLIYSGDGKFLSVSSLTDTGHIFKLAEDFQEQSKSILSGIRDFAYLKIMDHARILAIVPKT